MIIIFAEVIIILILIILAATGVIFIDVYKILKLVNYEMDVNIIKFDKYVLPYNSNK